MNFYKKSSMIMFLIFLLSSCNVNTTSNLSSSITNGQPSQTTTISNITIGTDSNTNQFIGLNTMTLVNAQITGNNVNNVKLEWFLNGVKSLTQEGLSFEFFANSASNYEVYAKFGSVISNKINFNVDYPSFSVTDIQIINNKTIRVYTSPGVNFSVPSLLLDSNSSYRLNEGYYNLNFLNEMVQGRTYSINMSKSGFKNLTQTFLYDTRSLTLVSLSLDSIVVRPDSTNTFNIIRPFTTGDPDKNYVIRLTHKNLENITFVSRNPTSTDDIKLDLSIYENITILSKISLDYDIFINNSLLVNSYLNIV
jgi:hypothetical protein